MKRPSNKFLYGSMLLVLLLTIIGMLFTLSSYYHTQKHAVALAKDQLTTINRSAINVIQTRLQSYQLALKLCSQSLSTDNIKLEEPISSLDEQHTQENPAAAGLYLFSSEGTLLDSRKLYSNPMLSVKDRTKVIAADPYFKKAIETKNEETSDVYFLHNHSYINLYQPLSLETDKHALLVMPIDLQNLYRTELMEEHSLNGYTMVKNQEMKVVMHPSQEQIGLGIIEGRKEKFPDLDLSDLVRLEKEQLANQKGSLSYHSYWWTDARPKQVLKITSYEWVTLGNAHLVFASNEDYYEKNGLLIQDDLITLGLLMLLLVVILLLGFATHYYLKRNQTYHENQKLRERQHLLQEKHELEKSILQQSKLETIGLLTTTIVHDMNNFLTPMIGNLQLLIEEHQGNEILTEDLQEVYHAAEKGLQLSKNVLRFSKIDTMQKNKHSIAPVIEEAIQMLRVLLPKSLTLEISLSGNGIACFEKDDLQIILYNLITNAYQARNDCCIHLMLETTDELPTYFEHRPSFQQKNSFAVIKIADNGPGIPPEIQDKIFTPFFTTKTASGGTGLGLFIVASIAKKNDWLLHVTSNEKGTTFSLGIAIEN